MHAFEPMPLARSVNTLEELMQRNDVHGLGCRMDVDFAHDIGRGIERRGLAHRPFDYQKQRWCLLCLMGATLPLGKFLTHARQREAHIRRLTYVHSVVCE